MGKYQEKERLVKILNNIVDNIFSFHPDTFIDEQADELLKNGVHVPPCKVDDKVFLVIANRVSPCVVEGIYYSANSYVCLRPLGMYETVCRKIPFEEFFEAVFYSKEDAERAKKNKNV